MRDFVLYVILIVNLVSMVAMVAGMLMHSGRGGGLSDMFGGGGDDGPRLVCGRAQPEPDHHGVRADLDLHGRRAGFPVGP